MKIKLFDSIPRVPRNKVTSKDRRRMREILWETNRKCVICGEFFVDFKDTTLDHIIPISRGGTNNIKNMQLAHKMCNKTKGNKANINKRKSNNRYW